MSRLSDLIAQTKAKDAQLGADLEREMKALTSRRAFGLNFERHMPETVELPGRSVRKGDKVRFLPSRGESPASIDRRLWRVKAMRRIDGRKVAELAGGSLDGKGVEVVERVVEDLVVVAEFRDPIYPGLKSTGKVERGADRPYHAVINAENFHALQMLLYTHEGKVDAIYIDPPYNTGAKDWKYNNDYVDGEDAYRHSKWLAFMERRLKLAGRLLNAENSVLIVTIDEKEYLRLGILLEQSFPQARIQMVSVIIKPEGTNRAGEFSRTNEYIYFVMFGSAKVQPYIDDMSGRGGDASTEAIAWRNLRRRENTSVRAARPNQFYAVFVSRDEDRIHSVGDALPPDVSRSDVTVPEGCDAVFPLKPDGTEMLWGVTPESLRRLVKKGYARASNVNSPSKKIGIQYLASGTVEAIEAEDVVITGRDSQGAVEGYFPVVTSMPKTTWNRDSHNAQTAGTLIVSALTPNRRFPFPKSLYAVEDALRFFVADKPKALVLDFFCGSGTTAHALMRLNRQDNGCRQSISVTNNEVSVDEQKGLRSGGFRPGDAEWEMWGICDYITKPRLQAAITGHTHEGNPIKGDYKFADEFPMADGFKENIEFFTMTYEAQRPVAHNKSFAAIAPLLWLKAGACGRRIEKPSEDFDVADTYGVLFDIDCSHAFIKELGSLAAVRLAFVVTDEDRAYQSVCAELPSSVEPVRLYESYLTSFAINTGKE